jgi:acyl-CoA reductase-like NAD-dependent aldehyde dehydrogenase
MSNSSFEPFHAGILVDGRWRSGTKRIEIRDPACFDELVGTAMHGSVDDVDQAIAAAKSAQASWARIGFKGRAAILYQVLDRLDQDLDDRAALYVRENGRTLAEARAELGAIAANQRLTLQLADVLEEGRMSTFDRGTTLVRHMPFGVVVSIIPWNAPVTLAMLQIIPALLAGNSVVLKPPESCPLTLIRTIELFDDLLPAGTLNVITGFPAEIGDRLTTHPDVGKIGFTGSISSAQHIMANAAASIKGVTLELGGNDPAIVLSDADLSEDAMKRIVGNVFQCSGQVCMAIKRVYVADKIRDAFLESFRRVADRIVVGHGLNPRVAMGPMHTKAGVSRAAHLINDSKSRGAEIVTCGSVADGTDLSQGYFVRPSMVVGLSDSAPLMFDEQFCPVIPISDFSDVEEVVRRSNDTHFGLGASVWGGDRERAIEIAKQLEAGTVFVNSHGISSINRNAPYGGIKQSGIGRKAALEGIGEYLQLQTLTIAR